MNGLYVARYNTVLTAYGPVNWGHPDLTDIWADEAGVMALAAQHPDAYARTEQDRISAHVPTDKGRVFLHRIDSSPWRPPRGNAKATLRLLDKLASILGVRALMYSPTARGIALLDYTRRDHPDWFRRELPLNWGDRDDAVTPNFTRRISDHKQRDWVLHKFDLRAAWPAAARTTLLGYGPVRGGGKWDGKTPGIWPVRINRGVANHAPIITSGYYDTAIVRAALHAGQDITIMPGQVWPAHATCLRSYTERILTARSRAHGEAQYDGESDWLIGAIKSIYTRAGGALASYKQSRAWAHQPHWYYAYRAESARRIWHRINDLNNAGTAYVIGVDTDSIFAVAPPGMAYTAIFPDADPFAFNAGRLRYEGRCQMTQELFDMLGCPGSVLSAKLREGHMLQDWGEKA